MADQLAESLNHVSIAAPGPSTLRRESASNGMALAVDFIVVGGGIGGLACAIALTRVGHRVLVLEKEDGTRNAGDHGFQIPPNMSKVLFHWGLKDQLRQYGLVSHTMLLIKYETGDSLGTQEWDEAVLKESRGDVFLITHRALHKVLYDAALTAGVTVRHNAPVERIDASKPEVHLASGEILTADVIVGADGPGGLSRLEVIGNQDPGKPIGISMYDATVPTQYVSKELIKEGDHNTFVAFGSGRFIVSYPIPGGKQAIHFYTRDNGTDGEYGTHPSGDLSQLMVNCESRLKEMAQHASAAIRIPIKEYTNNENWVHRGGRLVVIGQAAHPYPPGAIQRGAMAVEDAAVLGKLFSHLQYKDQIGHFLWAFQDLRQPRIQSLHPKELHNATFPLAGDAEAQQPNEDATAEVDHSDTSTIDDLQDNPAFEELRIMFGYDCEDEADNWWMEWGRLREQAREREGQSRA